MRSALVFAIAALALALPSVGNAAPPSNDNFANATSVASLPFSETVDLSEATLELRADPGNCWQLGSSAWYKLEPTAQDTRLQIASSANFDRVANIYRQNGSGLGGLSFVACGYQGNASPELQGGATYYVQVGQTPWYPSGGTLNLSLDVIPPPANDDFANAAAVSAVPVPTWSRALPARVKPASRWHRAVLPGTHWYAFTAPSSGSFTVRTSWVARRRPLPGIVTRLPDGAGLPERRRFVSDLRRKRRPGHVHPDHRRLQREQRADHNDDRERTRTRGELLVVAVGPLVLRPRLVLRQLLRSRRQRHHRRGASTSATDPLRRRGCCPQHRYLTDGDYTVTLTVTTSDGRTRRRCSRSSMC